LEAYSKRLKDKSWPYPIIELLLGTRSAEATLSSATKSEEFCEAHYYLGQWLLLRKEVVKAASEFEAAKASCPKTFFEYEGAIAELAKSNNSSESAEK
jgi:rhomboid protease GluP